MCQKIHCDKCDRVMNSKDEKWFEIKVNRNDGCGDAYYYHRVGKLDICPECMMRYWPFGEFEDDEILRLE